ncbi:hypothetical protein GCM10029976_083300 [Kribbella albertanoniae]
MTVWLHWAKSELDTAPLSAKPPLRTGLLTTDPPEQLQPLSEPLSKPGLVKMFAACAVWAPPTSTKSNPTTTARDRERQERMVDLPGAVGVHLVERLNNSGVKRGL